MPSNDQKTWLDDTALLSKVATRQEQKHASRFVEDKAYIRAYYDRPVVSGVDYTRPYRELAIYDALKDSQGGNPTREVVDAAAAILCRELKPSVDPKGEEFELDQGCKQASRLIEGVLDNSDFISVATRACIDGMTSCVGPIKGYVDRQTQEIKFERINPLEFMWVDDGTDDPRTFITVTPVPRDKLIAEFPGKKSQIMDLPNWSPAMTVGVDAPGSRAAGDDDTVRVTEAWARALGDTPGKHGMVSGDVVFHEEPWPHEAAPVFGFRWSFDQRGYGGVSLARIIGRYDSTIRRLMRMVLASLSGAVPRVLAHEDSEVDALGDQEYEVIKWSGPVEPKIVTPQVVSPDLVAQIDRAYTRMYAEGGVNQNMATGSAPARYTSGAAQREFVDIANTRLLLAQKRWEALWRDAARVIVMLAQQAKAAHVRVKGANYYESVKFPRLPRDKYVVSFGLESGLSLTPSARMQDLQDLKDMGLADTADLARGLGTPEVQGLSDRLNAPRDLVMQQISKALDKGVFEMPSAIQGTGLNDLIRIGGEEYQRARMQGNYPPAHMEILRRLILAAQARLTPPPAPPAPANDNGVPLAPGEQAPAQPAAPAPATPAPAVAAA